MSFIRTGTKVLHQREPSSTYAFIDNESHGVAIWSRPSDPGYCAACKSSMFVTPPFGVVLTWAEAVYMARDILKTFKEDGWRWQGKINMTWAHVPTPRERKIAARLATQEIHQLRHALRNAKSTRIVRMYKKLLKQQEKWLQRLRAERVE